MELRSVFEAWEHIFCSALPGHHRYWILCLIDIIANEDQFHKAVVFQHHAVLSSQDMDTKRDIKQIVYPSPLFPAHWSLFIPSKADPNVGKIIHAIEDALTGFQLEFKRGYDTVATSSRKTVLDLCTTDGVNVVDGPTERSTDQTPIDNIESKAAIIPVPGKILRSANSAVSTDRNLLGVGSGWPLVMILQEPTRVEVKNCQTWLRMVVEALIHDHIFPPEALVAIDAAPKNWWLGEPSLGNDKLEVALQGTDVSLVWSLKVQYYVASTMLAFIRRASARNSASSHSSRTVPGTLASNLSPMALLCSQSSAPCSTPSKTATTQTGAIL